MEVQVDAVEAQEVAVELEVVQVHVCVQEVVQEVLEVELEVAQHVVQHYHDCQGTGYFPHNFPLYGR